MSTLTFALRSLTPGWSELGVERSGTPSTMSAQEEPLKPQAKPRPEIPPKPSPQPDPPPPAGDAVAVQSVSGGKVKSIVSKFSRQDSVSNESEDGAVNGSREATKIKRLKRPPTIKPKPKSGRASLPMRMGGAQAPPLPMKRSRKPKVVVPADGGHDANVEGSRSGRGIIKCRQLASFVLELITAVGEGAGVPGSRGLKPLAAHAGSGSSLVSCCVPGSRTLGCC